jgi:hypothetical protein
MPLFPQVVQQLLVIDPIAQYGCAFDHRLTADGACNVGTSTTTINSATAAFTNQDLNKRVLLAGAGASGAMYVGTITGIQSATAVTVSPALSTTVSSKALQIHTDDLTSWTALITDLNNSPYPGGEIKIRAPWASSPGFTGRSGISSFLPAINKQVRISGYGGSWNSNVGDYTKAGGCGIVYCGGTSSAPTAFGAVMTIAPALGVSNQALKNVVLEHFFIDCRNGDQLPALKGLSLQSIDGWEVNDFFVMDPLAVGIEWLVVGPGYAVPSANSIGEAKDCTRGSARQVYVRALEAISSPGAISTTPVTTSTAVTLTTSGQSLTLSGAITNQPAAGYVWVQCAGGYPVLVNFTGGGGTATLTGCTVSAQDAVNAPTTVSGSNVQACQPTVACGFLVDGDLTANTCLNHWDTCQIQHGTAWGPAAVEFRNSDSNEFTNVCINGGTVGVYNAINRYTKPGIRLLGSSTNVTLPARGNVFKSGSPGVGGFYTLNTLNTGALLPYPSGPHYYEDHQLGNGESIPLVDLVTTSATQGACSPFVRWNANGGFKAGRVSGPTGTGTQTISATTALVLGSQVTVPVNGFQVGTILRWVVPVSKTLAGTAARTMAIKYGAAGSTSDATTIATASVTPTAAADQGVYYIEMVITALGSGTSATALAQMYLVHNSASAAGLGTNNTTMTMAGFNSTLPSAGPAFLELVITTGTSEVLTVLNPVYCECISPGNP